MGRVFVSENMSKRTDFQPGDTFTRCNFGQPEPNTPICVGVPRLTFESCNLINCVVPNDAIAANTVA